ncbi:elongation factor G, mitochondrial-like isoform X2 [Medicago truncatula]|uniref:elongation factor G, mitochondrial-like isoform X2 n=1 Tax=Medicago truncatula TaxID=3880 RepID=UPI00196778DC|nr:elongation factor G, mitochondrial-like isoform X2 [Medicago truncatula]
MLFLVQGLQLLLDGVLNYLPCPIEASNYALDQYKREEKVRRLLGRHNERHTLVASAFTLKKYSGHMTYLRIYEGVLRKGDFITDVDTSRKFEVRGLFGLYNDEVILEAHVGEMVGVIHSEPGKGEFSAECKGLRKYTSIPRCLNVTIGKGNLAYTKLRVMNIKFADFII